MVARSRSRGATRRTRGRSTAHTARRAAPQPTHPIVDLAARHIGEAYVFGTRAPMANASWRGPWDCAEFVSWCVFHATGVLYGTEPKEPLHADAFTGWWAEQARADGAAVTVELAARTPGAVVLRVPATGRTGHIAICDGHGGTIEAHSSADGVSRHRVGGRIWD
ncbi:MAG: CHAP domain-containing protein, partial [Myxococcota bacterium]